MRSMIFTSLLFCTLMALSPAISAQSLESKVLGLWSIGDGDESFVQFAKTELGLLDGTIVITDVNRSIGKLLFTEGEYDKKSNSIIGYLLHPDSGLRVKGTLTLENDDKLKVVASKFFLYKTFYWTRAKEAEDRETVPMK